MASTAPSEEAVERYCQRIKRLCPNDPDEIPLWPGYRSLKTFIDGGHACKKPPGISIVSIPGVQHPTTQFSIAHMIGPRSLLENLTAPSNTSSSQLIIVENICPVTLTALGAMYDVDPQFFAEHINVLTWYNMYEKVPERLVSLPSTKKEEDFLTLKYVDTRELELSDNASVYAKSILWPDPRHTRVRHSAGKLEPISRPGRDAPRMVFSRQTVSVWCREKPTGDGWIAIMLLDSPFRLPKRHGAIGRAEYRNPNLRPKSPEENQSGESRQAFRLAFCNLLSQRLSKDSMYLKTCSSDIFLVLYEGYRIVASEWLVVNEYVRRELADIEFHLEKSESTFLQLETYLRELYRIRRRCNKDRELVMEAATQCKKGGQALWPSAVAAPDGSEDAVRFAQNRAEELVEDLQFVIDNMSINISRVEKNITLLMGLVTISEGRQGLQENRAILFLTLIATVFLPSETVATILGMQTQYGPGTRSFWLLWAIALPLTVLVIAMPYLYRTLSSMTERLLAKYLQSSSKDEPQRMYGLEDEGTELSDDPVHQVHQAHQVSLKSMEVLVEQV